MSELGRQRSTRIATALIAAALCTAAATPGRTQQSGAQQPYRPPDTATVERDIVYATYGDRELMLDLYMPADRGAEPIPGIVVIRGGGWRQGDKESFGYIAGHLAAHGLAAISIEYRVVPEATWPAAINDSKAAVRWLRAHAEELGIGPRAIGAIGGSAGAHLAALLAVTHRMDELDGEGGNPEASNRVQAVVALATPASFVPQDGDAGQLQSNPAVTAFLGATYQENPDLWSRASPSSHVHAGAAPILLIHSNADRTVAHVQSVRLAELYEHAGAVAELVTIEGAPHAFWRDRRWRDETLDLAVAFFRKQLSQP